MTALALIGCQRDCATLSRRSEFTEIIQAMLASHIRTLRVRVEVWLHKQIDRNMLRKHREKHQNCHGMPVVLGGIFQTEYRAVNLNGALVLWRYERRVWIVSHSARTKGGEDFYFCREYGLVPVCGEHWALHVWAKAPCNLFQNSGVSLTVTVRHNKVSLESTEEPYHTNEPPKIILSISTQCLTFSTRTQRSSRQLATDTRKKC